MSTPIQDVVPIELRSDPDLFLATQQIKSRLEQLIEEHDIHDARREMMWGCGEPLQKTDFINLTVRESDELGRRFVSRATDSKSLLDPLRRESMLLSMLGELLQKRWRIVNDRLMLDLRRFEEAELTHAH